MLTFNDACGYRLNVIQMEHKSPGQSLAKMYQLRVRQHHTTHPAQCRCTHLKQAVTPYQTMSNPMPMASPAATSGTPVFETAVWKFCKA